MESHSNIWVQILILLILIATNAFFAASEIAMISINAAKIRKKAEEGNHKAQILQNLIEEPSKFLATLQVGVTLAGLLASAVASESFADRLTLWIRTAEPRLEPTVIKLAVVIIITFVLSYFQLVLGELVPKRLAMQKPERISWFAVKPLYYLSKLAAPFVKFLSFSTNFVIKIFGGNPFLHEEKISEEEIRLMVEVGQEKGVIQTTEKEMINNIFEFDNTTVSEVMTHRTDVIGLPLNSSFDEVIDELICEKFSRLPIYDETIDNIVGILHVQDLIPILKDINKNNFSLEKIIREPYVVPSSKKTDELFKELQRNKIHMAVVIDEYGGTAGIVTIEDLIEEIVGNIFDEHDEEIKEVERVDNHTFIVDGHAALCIVSELLDMELPEGDYDTLAGFVVAQLGRIPGEDEKPAVEFHDTTFQVEAVEERRIAKVKIIKT